MPAVAKYDKNYVGPIGNIKKLLSGKNKGKLVYRKYNKDPISGIQSVVEFFKNQMKLLINLRKELHNYHVKADHLQDERVQYQHTNLQKKVTI